MKKLKDNEAHFSFFCLSIFIMHLTVKLALFIVGVIFLLSLWRGKCRNFEEGVEDY